MWRSMMKVALATAAFGVVHSLLASRAAKRAAAEAVGRRNRDGLYRAFFNAQSVVALAMLGAYISRQPSRELYRVRGPLALLMHAGQVAALGYATWAAHQVGIRRIIGLENFLAWLGDGPVPDQPEAQGPALDAEGRARDSGPFAWSRHPLNFAPVVIFWLWPRMTTNLLAYNSTATAYLVLGSWHEEVRLRQVHGGRYAAYQRSGVPFYLPRPARDPLEPLAEVRGVGPAIRDGAG